MITRRAVSDDVPSTLATMRQMSDAATELHDPGGEDVVVSVAAAATPPGSTTI